MVSGLKGRTSVPAMDLKRLIRHSRIMDVSQLLIRWMGALRHAAREEPATEHAAASLSGMERALNGCGSTFALSIVQASHSRLLFRNAGQATGTQSRLQHTSKNWLEFRGFPRA